MATEPRESTRVRPRPAEGRWLEIWVPILIVVWLLPGVVTVLLWPATQLMHLALWAVGGFAVSQGVFPT